MQLPQKVHTVLSVNDNRLFGLCFALPVGIWAVPADDRLSSCRAGGFGDCHPVKITAVLAKPSLLLRVRDYIPQGALEMSQGTAPAQEEQASLAGSPRHEPQMSGSRPGPIVVATCYFMCESCSLLWSSVWLSDAFIHIGEKADSWHRVSLPRRLKTLCTDWLPTPFTCVSHRTWGISTASPAHHIWPFCCLATAENLNFMSKRSQLKPSI